MEFLAEAPSGVSVAARSILERRPLAWELKFFNRVLQDRIESLKDLKRDFDAELVDTAAPQGHRLSLEDLGAWAAPQLARFRSLVDKLQHLVNVELQTAMGLPGTAGEPAALAGVATEVARCCKESMEWSLQWRELIVEDEARPMIEVAARMTVDMVAEIYDFARRLERELASIPDLWDGVQRTVKVRLTIDLPEADALVAEWDRLPELLEARLRKTMRADSQGEAGWIYVLVNSSMPDLVKVGRTSRDPRTRAQELSGVTGVPTPFVVAYEKLVPDSVSVEEYVHVRLEELGFRVASNREFFAAPVSDVVDVVLEAIAQLSGTSQVPDASDDGPLQSEDVDDDGAGDFDFELDDAYPDADYDAAPWQDLLDQGEESYFGTGEELQDFDVARSLFQKAARLGSGAACIHLGAMAEDGEGMRSNVARAIKWYRQATALVGGHAAWARLGELYWREGQSENSTKAWDRYFGEGYEAVEPSDRAARAWHYFERGLSDPTHIEKMVPDRSEIVAYGERVCQAINSDWGNQIFQRMRYALREPTQRVVELEASRSDRWAIGAFIVLVFFVCVPVIAIVLRWTIGP